MVPRLIRRTLALSGGALAVFHGWLFVGQAAAGRLEDPWLLFRWIAAASLIAALAAVRRSGQSVWGRKGIAIWVLAALLHGPAVAGSGDVNSFALSEGAATSVVQLLSSAAVALGALLLARLFRARPAARRFTGFVSAFAAALRTIAAITLQFAPRPPPLRA
jgi:hypothetical protein